MSFSTLSFGLTLAMVSLTVMSNDLDCKYAVAEVSDTTNTAVPLDVCYGNRGSNYISSIWSCSDDYKSVTWTFYDSEDCTGGVSLEYTYDVISQNCNGTMDCSFKTRQYQSDSGVYECDIDNDEYVEEIYVPTICSKAGTLSTMSWCDSDSSWSQAIYSTDDCSGSFTTITTDDGCIEGYTDSIYGLEYDVPAYYNDVIYCNVEGYAPESNGKKVTVLKSIYMMVLVLFIGVSMI